MRRAGFYRRRVFPWLNDRLTTDPELTKLRAEALAPARGHVIEIGFGTGLNVVHYPPTVESLVGIEPNQGMADRAKPRIREAALPIRIVFGAAEEMPLQDGLFDTAVSTLTLCSVVDVGEVLREVRRVLKTDGRLLILEHGLSDDTKVARWQRRLNPVQKLLACGCHLNRPIAALVERHGFRFESVRQWYADGIPRTHGWICLGIAVKA